MDRIVGGIIYNSDNQILMQLRDNKKNISDPGLWTFPGGKVEIFEKKVSALYREIFEETNIKIKTYKFFKKLKISTNKTIFLYFIPYDGKSIIRCGEGQKLEFHDFKNLSKLESPNYISILLESIRHHII